MSEFIRQLGRGWDASDSLVCVGLDPEIERFPRHIAAQASPIFQFNKAIIDATADLVCAYKPQFAHYAAYEAEDQLERTIEYIHRSYPGIPVIRIPPATFQYVSAAGSSLTPFPSSKIGGLGNIPLAMAVCGCPGNP